MNVSVETIASEGSVLDKSNRTPVVQRIHVAGTPIAIITTDKLFSLIDEWIAERRGRYIVFRDVHGAALARNDSELRLAHERADLVLPDGMPLVWAARAAGFKEATRICGPDFLPAACAYGLSRGWRHYFYGGTPDIAEALVESLIASFPGLIITGTQCPPFRPLTEEEDEAACSAIRAAKPDLIWIGLGTPKQEAWMATHCGKLNGALLLGIGAAFTIHARAISRAPKWAQRSGLEWCYRLVHEPSRLWKRYLVVIPAFVLLSAGRAIVYKTRKLARQFLRRVGMRTERDATYRD